MRRWSLLVFLSLSTTLAYAHSGGARPWSVADLPVVKRLQAPREVPTVPAGTTSLRFEQFFRLPVGSRGLEPTSTLLGLNGTRVRLFGYMVLHDAPQPGVFLLSPLPVTLAEQADGAADDLPPAVVTVRLPPKWALRVVPFVPGILMVEGMLGVGDLDEPDGRRSLVRLQLDWPASVAVPGGVK
jgi:hypothetical protein